MLYTFGMVIGISLYAIYYDDWINDEDYRKHNEAIQKKIDTFAAPPFCIIPKISTSFCFQFYFLQIITTMRRQSNTQGRTESNTNTESSDIKKPKTFAACTMGVVTISLIGLIYLMTFTISWLATSRGVLNLTD